MTRPAKEILNAAIYRNSLNVIGCKWLKNF